MASVIMSRTTRQKKIIFKIHSYHDLHEDCATRKMHARSGCDVVVDERELC